MAGRTTYNVSRPSFICDPHSIMRNGGKQIDWANVDASLKNAEGNKVIPAGTIMVTLASGKVIRRIDAARVAETSSMILESTAVENDRVVAKSGYGFIVGGVIYRNLLAEGAHASIATFATELNTNGYGWVFEIYADNTPVNS